MGRKRKLEHFEEMKNFENVFQPELKEVFNTPYFMKGKWRESYFKNDLPLILELGCGKGEYSIGLARKFPNKNFIGVDIKGARMWRGAKTALEEKMKNVAFLRSRIEFIASCFAEKEVDEIWITFPDPQPKEKKEKKRLTSPLFVREYLKFLKPDGVIHLKTDNRFLYHYTLEQVRQQNFSIIESTSDLYGEKIDKMDEDAMEILSIQTHYEKLFMGKGHKIHYLKFIPKHGDCPN